MNAVRLPFQKVIRHEPVCFRFFSVLEDTDTSNLIKSATLLRGRERGVILLCMKKHKACPKHWLSLCISNFVLDTKILKTTNKV